MSVEPGFSEESLREIARVKVNFRFSVLIHYAVFIFVSILLLTINLLFTRQIFWIIFPFFGWFIGIVMHTIGYLVYARGVYPLAKRTVIFHMFAYLSVMLFLFLVNFYTMPEKYWVLFPAIFWGIAVLVHYAIYMIYFKSRIDEPRKSLSRREKAIEREMKKMKKKINK
ncbi:hypothetical protein LCGC14_0496720 [marine sediment metagenome]|uniref:2TM domain-containing protein n=1 Tax=marine sediment metagenome TaxID=412755 RepID=A0A0F9R707_9ZZZZ|nr:MAG: hypothetical protein Lokiarch_32070 [Candidatus Lokiarchaeum sp. GC14_75]